MWRVSALLLGTALFSALCVWWSRAGDHGDYALPSAPAEVAAVVETPPPPRIGRAPSSVGRLLPDAFVVTSCTVVPAQEQEVSSQLDGVFRELLVDVGQTVARGQVLGRLDDRQVRPQAELLEIKAASRSAELIAKAQHDEADWRVRYATKANESGLRSVSELESQTYRLQRERFAQEVRKACEDQEAARKELERARHLLALHEIRSGLDGVVVKVAKREGEAVKGQESLFRVADFRRLRIEGLCRVQQADLLRPGMRAAVEPEIPGEPIKELVGHTGAVTALAVSADGHWVVSASEDRTVALWGWPSAERRAVLPHPAEVYAVALIPIPEGTSLALLTGCADGRVRRWTVTEGGAVDGPTAWADGHEGAVRGLAVSPDGRWCATAGEDRRVGVWDLATGARQDWLQAARGTGTAHQGAATWVRFTPDGHLLSAGRDNQVRVWRQDGGAWGLAASHAGRTGEVTHLGVSPNGQRVLLDHGEELRIVGRDDGGFQGALRARRQARFQGFAHFSPSGRLILAAGSNGRIQLWKAPASPEQAEAVRRGAEAGFRRSSLLALGALGGRLPSWTALTAARAEEAGPAPRRWALHGYEVRSLVAPTAAPARAAAFAPDEGVVFAGGADRTIRVWAVPPPREWAEPREATLTYVAGQTERGTDQVRIRAELANPDDPALRLRPGTSVDLRLFPDAPPTR